MALIRTQNNIDTYAPYTRVSSSVVSGATTTPAENTTGLATSWAVQIGRTGHEQTEVVIGTPATGTSITHPALAYDHPEDTPVYFIKYDKVVFERSTTGTTGTATEMTGGTVTYQADSFYTIFDDTSGSSAYGYKTYFRNSVLAVNSTESDWITFAGNSFHSLGKLRTRIRNKLWNSDFINNDTLNEWINECKDNMTNKVIQVNEDYSLGTETVGFGTDGYGTVTTADFSQARRIWVTYDSVNNYQSTKMPINGFIPNQVFSSSHPYHAWIGDNVFIVKPSDSPGSADIVFYRFGTTMVNDTDVLPLPMRPYTNIFTEYCRAQGYYKENRINEGDSIMNRVGTMMDDFSMNIAPRDKTGPTQVQIVEPYSGETFIY